MIPECHLYTKWPVAETNDYNTLLLPLKLLQVNISWITESAVATADSVIHDHWCSHPIKYIWLIYILKWNILAKVARASSIALCNTCSLLKPPKWQHSIIVYTEMQLRTLLWSNICTKGDATDSGYSKFWCNMLNALATSNCPQWSLSVIYIQNDL